MFTRIRVKGFKNLVDTQVRFGPFTCIAGANAVGKSNLFDAIRFLSLLANGKLDEAGRAIRSEGSRNADVRSLFTRVAGGKLAPIELEADMIIPPTALDELRQNGNASTTFVQYRIRIGYRHDLDQRRRLGELELLSEELTYIPTTAAAARLGFEYSKDWRESVIIGSKRSPLIYPERSRGAVRHYLAYGRAVQFTKE
jgi:predicted ATPase